MAEYTSQELKELQDLIAIGHYKPNLLNQYKRLFKIFMGKPFVGCNCAASTMYGQLKQYLIVNKLNR